MPDDNTPFPWSLNPADYMERKGTWFFILILCGSGLAIILLMVVALRYWQLDIMLEKTFSMLSLIIQFLNCLLPFRNRVAIAIELIEEGSVACGQMLATLFFPPVPFILQVN